MADRITAEQLDLLADTDPLRLRDEAIALLTEVEQLTEQMESAREQAAADLEAHAKELTDAAIQQVLADDPAGFNASLRAATVAYSAKYLRGETPGA